MTFSITIHTQNSAGHLNLAVEKVESRDGKLVRLLDLAGVPLCRIPGDVDPVQADLPAYRVGSNHNSGYIG